MKPINSSVTLLSEDEDMLPEYDFSVGVRGKHAAAYQKGYRVTIHKADGSIEMQELTLPPDVIQLDPDVRVYFKDAKTVNQTLRSLIALLPHSNPQPIN